jgi:hypothetical protein
LGIVDERGRVAAGRVHHGGQIRERPSACRNSRWSWSSSVSLQLLNHYYLIDQMTGGKWGKKPPADEQVDRAGKAGQKDAAEAPDASPAS